MSSSSLENMIGGQSDAVPDVPARTQWLRHMGYVIESSGSRLRAETRGIAVVLTVSGRVDAINVGLLGTNLVRFVGLRVPLVVVMDSETEEACGQTLLNDFDAHCRRADVAWALVDYPAGEVVRLPRAHSIAAATRQFFDEARRERGSHVASRNGSPTRW